MSKEEIKFEGVANGFTIAEWMLIDDKYQHIIITVEWLPNGKRNHKFFLNGELESENGVKYIKPKEDEKDRYYAPSIEEFHVGFEFEEKPKGCTEFEGWVKQTIHKGGSSIENHFNSSKLRVKYLDQEDIESLGFIKYTNNSVGENINVVKTINSIEFDLQNIKAFHKAVGSRAIMAKGFDIDILLNVDTNTVHIFDITKDKYPIFKGTIKNKSELKKILKMLNIN